MDRKSALDLLRISHEGHGNVAAMERFADEHDYLLSHDGQEISL